MLAQLACVPHLGLGVLGEGGRHLEVLGHTIVFTDAGMGMGVEEDEVAPLNKRRNTVWPSCAMGTWFTAARDGGGEGQREWLVAMDA